MRVLIFGGTGPTGIALIRKAIQVYPSSTIFLYVRSPHKIPDDLARNSSVVIIRGELTQIEAIEAALSGTSISGDGNDKETAHPVDVVLSALGPSGPCHSSNLPIAKFYEALIPIMAKHAIKRLIVLGTAAYSDPRDKFNPISYGIATVVSTFAHSAYAEFKTIGELLRLHGDKAELEWTLVRVPLLTNSESEQVVVGYVDWKTGNLLSRKAFAAFAVGEIEKREWVGKAPMISSVCSII